jgi:hypothetical protein
MFFVAQQKLMEQKHCINITTNFSKNVLCTTVKKLSTLDSNGKHYKI